MAAKRGTSRKAAAGPRGPRGKTGPAGGDHASDIARLSSQVNQILKEQQIQLTRIAQMQVQLDRLATDQAPESAEKKTAGHGIP
jgi:hypothetical protein